MSNETRTKHFMGGIRNGSQGIDLMGNSASSVWVNSSVYAGYSALPFGGGDCPFGVCLPKDCFTNWLHWLLVSARPFRWKR